MAFHIFFKYIYMNLFKSTEKITLLIEIATNQNLLSTFWCDYFCRYTIVSSVALKLFSNFSSDTQKSHNWIQIVLKDSQKQNTNFSVGLIIKILQKVTVKSLLGSSFRK